MKVRTDEDSRRRENRHGTRHLCSVSSVYNDYNARQQWCRMPNSIWISMSLSVQDTGSQVVRTL